jgi:hypothetical protein
MLEVKNELFLLLERWIRAAGEADPMSRGVVFFIHMI